MFSLWLIGIPVKYFPDNEDIIKPVQYAALFTDLVKHTRFALKQLDINDQNSLQGFQSLRMRTGDQLEYIVTEFVTPTSQNAYILVSIQSCKFTIDEEIAGDEEEGKEWLAKFRQKTSLTDETWDVLMNW